PLRYSAPMEPDTYYHNRLRITEIFAKSYPVNAPSKKGGAMTRDCWREGWLMKISVMKRLLAAGACPSTTDRSRLPCDGSIPPLPGGAVSRIVLQPDRRPRIRPPAPALRRSR